MENLNEEKQIEEMAEYIFGNAITHDTRFKEDCRSIAMDLYAASYRKQEWISVEDRLPEENGRYLACVKISHLAFDIPPMVVIMGYNKIHGFDTISGEETVTHWMPLPEAPKMKNTEN